MPVIEIRKYQRLNDGKSGVYLEGNLPFNTAEDLRWKGWGCYVTKSKLTSWVVVDKCLSVYGNTAICTIVTSNPQQLSPTINVILKPRVTNRENFKEEKRTENKTLMESEIMHRENEQGQQEECTMFYQKIQGMRLKDQVVQDDYFVAYLVPKSWTITTLNDNEVLVTRKDGGATKLYKRNT